MVNKIRYLIVIILFTYIVLLIVGQLSTKGCASCDYMKGVRNSTGQCNLVCMHVPRWKITIFELTGYKIK